MRFITKYWILIGVVFLLFIFVKPAICFLMLGLLISTIGLEAIRSMRKIEKKGVGVKGNIIEYKSNKEGNISPIIEFTTINGELIIGAPYIYSSADLSIITTYKVGQSIGVLYDADDPQKFVLNNDLAFNYTVFVFLIIVGFLFIVLSIIWLLGYIDMN